MYKLRMLSQALVALFVLLSVGAVWGVTAPPPELLTIVAGAAMLWLATCRTTWLPFLGPTVMPAGVFDARIPKGADVKFSLPAPPDAIKCVFWGSVAESKDPYEAYGGYANSGVADVEAGTNAATIALKMPKAYSVYGKRLAPHVHYRWVTARGMLSGVRTVTL